MKYDQIRELARLCIEETHPIERRDNCKKLSEFLRLALEEANNFSNPAEEAIRHFAKALVRYLEHLDCGTIQTRKEARMERGTIVRLERFGLGFVEMEGGSEQYPFSFDKIEGYRGQPLKSLGLRLGAVVMVMVDQDGKVEGIYRAETELA